MQNNLFINFSDRESILKMLLKLNADTKPNFGILTAQLMVEHLAVNIQFSNGNNPLNNYSSANRMIDYLNSNQPMPTGAKFFLVGNKLAEPLTKNLGDALELLKNELDKFEKYFTNNPLDKPIHAVFGSLNKREWEIAHSKHFTHHFKQFNIYD
jgi:hypothetical protein